MRARNTHPNRPLMCSGIHLQPGVWMEVPDSFASEHGGVPDLEFEENVPSLLDSPSERILRDQQLPAKLASEPPTQPTGRPEPDEELADAANEQAAPPPLREWAQENGWPELKDGRRRVPQAAQAAYEAAFP